MLAFVSWHQLSAQDAARLSDGRPNLNGIWQAVNAANWNLEPHRSSQGAVESLGAVGAVSPGIGVVDGNEIPYLPAARAQRDENRANRRTNDPEAKCFLPGIPRATYMPQPFQILQSENEIFFAYEFNGAVRSIFMRDQIPAPVDSWMGWSNGSWDGDSLVIEVTGLNGETWLDRSGNFLSATARVVERYTPMGPTHLEYEATIEDETLFSRPWTIRMPLYRRLEPGAQLLEFKCVEFVEELMYGHLRKPGRADESGDSDE